jgi:hypothetical protein
MPLTNGPGYGDDSEPSSGPMDRDETADGPTTPEPPRPVNWNLLTAEQAEAEWIELNRWVNWLRRTYGLPASIIPPLWHRHPELVWELSALHVHWLCAYDPDQHGSAAVGWHRDFAEARQRLHDWATNCGTRLDRDRTTRQTSWPGEDPAPAVEDTIIKNRDEDFISFVLEDTASRRAAEEQFYAAMDGSAE